MTDLSEANRLKEGVRDYYGEVLGSSKDLKTSACCTAEAMPPRLRALTVDIHPEVRDRFYGCGSPIPPAVEGCTVLDLGCGSGRDCFLLSRLVGPSGRVIGIDMTPEQLAVARKHRGWHAKRYGYETSNVEFRDGSIEDLAAAGIPDASVDVVVSNCVINLSPEKERVFPEILRVLKPGGELLFSDIFADRRISPELRNDPVLVGECLAGAMYLEDFRRLMNALEIRDVRTLSSGPVTIDDPSLAERLGTVRFSSRTIRAFKLELEDRCEDYGQIATYLGMGDLPHAFELDDHHCFETGRSMPVCGNTADMLSRTRFGPYFDVSGDRSVHYGLFDCAPGDTGAQPRSGCC